MFLAYTGCRISEALDLQIKRLDLAAGKATFIGKIIPGVVQYKKHETNYSSTPDNYNRY